MMNYYYVDKSFWHNAVNSSVVSLYQLSDGIPVYFRNNPSGIGMIVQYLYLIKESPNLDAGIFEGVLFKKLSNVLNIIYSLVRPIYFNHFLEFILNLNSSMSVTGM